LLDEGDTVVVERPTYLAALQALSLAGATYACIDVDDEGGQVEQLLERAPDPRIKLAYVVSTFSNPSGTTMSRARREALVRWAMKYQVIILEDDPYGELRAAGERVESIYSIAASIPGASDWVCYTSTLSKIIAPGLRVGWLVMPPALVDLVVRIKQAMDLHSSSFAQQVAAAYLESGRLPAHIERIRTEYAKRQLVLRDLLGQAFGVKLKLRHSEGGMFLWGEFTDGTNTRDLLRHALELGVMFVPGDVFYAADPQTNAIRLNFTSASVERLELGVARLQQAHRSFAALTKAAA
jgi:2-aminoadipate transaminase